MPFFDPSDKPNLTLVNQVNTHLVKLWNPGWEVFKKSDDFFRQQFDVWPSEHKDRPAFHTSKPTNLILHAVSNLMGHDPKVSRPPAGEGDAHKDKADKVEQGLQAILEDAALFEAIPPYRAFDLNLVRYDYAILEGPMLEPTPVIPKPRRRKNESQDDYEDRVSAWEVASRSFNPFRVRAPNPRSVLMEPTEKNPTYALQKKQKYGYEVAYLTKKKAQTREGVQLFDRGDADPFQVYTLWELWTLFHHAVLWGPGPGQRGGQSNSANELLYVEENAYGFLPFKHAWGGRGAEDSEDLEVRTDHLGIGILVPLFDSLKREAQTVSALHNLLIEASYAKQWTTDDAGELAQQESENDIVQVSSQNAIGIVPMAQIPNGIFQLQEGTNRDIEEGSFARTLTGLREEGVSTVGQTAILANQAIRQFIMAGKQKEHVVSQVAQDILRLIDLRKKPVEVRGKTIRPEEIEKHYSVNVTFPLVDPVLQFQAREIGMKEVQMGLKSKETYRNADLRLEDNTGEERRLAREMALLHPAAAAKSLAEGFRLLGMEDLAKFQEEQAKVLAMQAEMEAVGALPEPSGNGAQPSVRQPLSNNTAKPEARER